MSGIAEYEGSAKAPDLLNIKGKYNINYPQRYQLGDLGQ
jgi:hypothetical protein